VEATCDRILIINKGKIVADGSAENLRMQASGQEILKVRIEDGTADNILNELRSIRSVDRVEPIDKNLNRFEVHGRTGSSSKREIFNLCVQKGWVLSELIPIETRLEDIFRNLTMN
jgi:ABC-2 type transport system ATP-binding protein